MNIQDFRGAWSNPEPLIVEVGYRAAPPVEEIGGSGAGYVLHCTDSGLPEAAP